ncbi:MAG: type II secretion system protein GspM [Perlucidibaca sp.]
MSKFSDAMNQLSLSWQTLGERDRRALTLLTLVGLPLLLIGALMLPAMHARDNARVARDDAAQLVALMRQAGPRIQATGSVRISPAELPQRVQALAAAQGLTLERLESDPAGLRLAISNASLNTVTGFIGQCRSQGIKVIEAQISRDGGGNQIRLRLGA